MGNKKLSAVITLGGSISSSLKSAFSTTTGKLKEVGREIGAVTRQQRLMGSSIQQFGRMGKNVDTLRAKYGQLNTQLERLRKTQEKLEQSQARKERLGAVSRKMATVGAAMTAGGAATGAPLVVGTKEAKHYQTEMARITALGMGDDTSKKAFKFAQEMRTFGTSQLENLELLRDGMSVFADLHHAEMVAPTMAKMKFANKAVFGNEKGEQNSQQFMDMLKVIETRGGLKSEAEFKKQANIIQQVVSATGGRVGATEWRNMLSTGGLAGKSMSSESLFYTMEHMVQEMGGDRAGTGLNSLYKSLYQGVAKKRSVVNLGKLGLIGDHSKVKHDKAGQSASMEPGALLGADMFRENPFQWMETVLLPQLAKKGITDEKKVIDTIGMIVSNSVGGSFLAEMYRQRENIHKSEKRNRGAQNIDQLDTEGRKTAQGKELDAQAKLANLKLKVGQQILPMYTSALQAASGALETFNKFTAENPKLSTGLIVSLGAIAAALAIGGPLMIGLAILPTAVGGAALAWSGLGTAISVVGGILATVGRAMLLNPLGLAIAGIAVGGLLIYKYWEPIKGLFGAIGDKLAFVGTAWDKAKKFLGFGDGGAPGAKAAPAWPGSQGIPFARGAAAGSSVVDQSQNHFNIYQLPGESQQTLAERIAKAQRERAGVNVRSSMMDGGVKQ